MEQTRTLFGVLSHVRASNVSLIIFENYTVGHERTSVPKLRYVESRNFVSLAVLVECSSDRKCMHGERRF